MMTSLQKSQEMENQTPGLQKVGAKVEHQNRKKTGTLDRKI